MATFEGEPTRSAVTDKNGDWKIEGLNPNKEYAVRFIKPEGWEVTGKAPGSVSCSRWLRIRMCSASARLLLV